jgi:hypothetical protein
MHDGDPRAAIADLEARIEALSDTLERCRKIALASKLLVAVGAVAIVLMAMGAIPVAPVSVVGAISAALGGIVLFGSNASTHRQTAAAIVEAQMLRAELIGRIELKEVGAEHAGKRLLH